MRVTKEHLESQIESVEYSQLSGTLTHCTITVANGFKFTGESACVDPANFNQEIGEGVAYKNAFEKMWMPYGFLLKERAYTAPQDAEPQPKQLNMTRPLQRMVIERAELTERLDKLTEFLAKDKPMFVEQQQWDLMKNQKIAMDAYHAVLSARIELMSNEDNNHE